MLPGVSATPTRSRAPVPDRLEKAVKSSGFDRHLPVVNPNGKGLRRADRRVGAGDLCRQSRRMVPIVRTAYDLSIAVRFEIAETNSRPLAPGLPNKTPHDPR
jgi:hypothetical protein